MPASLLLLAACVGLEPVGHGPIGKDGSGDDTGGGISSGGLSIDTSLLDFGNVPLGDFSDEAVGLENTGTDPLDLTFSVDGAPFSITTTDLELTDTFALTVTFSPEDEGVAEGTLEVSVAGGDTLAVPLTGVGGEGGGDTETGGGDEGAGNLLVSPSRYAFGQVDLGDTETYSFTVSNTGDDDLLISEVSTSGAVWSTGGSLNPPQVLSPGANKLLEVSFTPTVATTYNGVITITSDDPDTPNLEIEVTGEGADLCDLCQPVIDVDTGSDPYAISDFFSIFGSTDSRTITVQNIGDMALTVSNVFVNNDSLATCGDFTVTGWRGATTLAAYGTTSFTLNYRATGSCLEVAQSAFDANVLHILSNDPTQGDWVVELSGAGL